MTPGLARCLSNSQFSIRWRQPWQGSLKTQQWLYTLPTKTYL